MSNNSARKSHFPVFIIPIIAVIVILFAVLGITSYTAKGPERTLLTLSEAAKDSDYDAMFDCMDQETQDTISSAYEEITSKFSTVASLFGLDLGDGDITDLLSTLNLDLSALSNNMTVEITGVTYEGNGFVDFLNKAPIPLKRGLLNLCATEATVSMAITYNGTTMNVNIPFVNEGHSTWKIHAVDKDAIEKLTDFFGISL